MRQIPATHVHGLFDMRETCASLFACAGFEDAQARPPGAAMASLERVADTLAEPLDLHRVFVMFG